VSLSQSQLTGLINKDDLKTQGANLQDFNSGAHLEEAVVEKDSKCTFHIFFAIKVENFKSIYINLFLKFYQNS